MRKETFQAAVEIARDSIRQVEDVLGASTPGGFAHFYKMLPAENREDYLRILIWCSEEITVAWDGVKLIVEELLREEKPLPPELAIWEADRLAGQRPRLTKNGPDPDGDNIRNRAIVDAVQWLTQNGFKATRNRIRNKRVLPEACFEGGSACDAVGVAAGMTYKAVERVWTESASPDSPICRRPLVVRGITSHSPPRV